MRHGVYERRINGELVRLDDLIDLKRVERDAAEEGLAAAERSKRKAKVGGRTGRGVWARGSGNRSVIARLLPLFCAVCIHCFREGKPVGTNALFLVSSLILKRGE